MKRILIAIAVLASACQSGATQQEDQQQQAPDSMVMVRTDTMIQVADTAIIPILKESWKSYESFEAKYAADVQLLQQQPLKDRLKALLGKDEKDFMERYKVTPPIEIDGGILFNEGCRPHDCSIEEAALAVDMAKDLIYVGIARNKVITFYGERGDTAWPAPLRAWREKFTAVVEN